MNDNNNFLGVGLFFLFIVGIIVVGSLGIYFSTRQKTEQMSNTDETVLLEDQYKEDKSKDLIYFENESTISEKLNITSKTPVINIPGEDAKAVNKDLKKLVSEVNNSLKKISNQNNPTCTYGDYDDIYETDFLDYGVYTYQNYLSLVIRRSTYDCENGISSTYKVKSYTFDMQSKKSLSSTELFQTYNTTFTNVKEQINNNLTASQSMVDDVPTLLIEETLNNLKEQDTYIAYIDEFGDLNVNYVVKTNTVDYNDTITING